MGPDRLACFFPVSKNIYIDINIILPMSKTTNPRYETTLLVRDSCLCFGDTVMWSPSVLIRAKLQGCENLSARSNAKCTATWPRKAVDDHFKRAFHTGASALGPLPSVQRTVREEVPSPAATATSSSLVTCGESQVASH